MVMSYRCFELVRSSVAKTGKRIPVEDLNSAKSAGGVDKGTSETRIAAF
jgi:hypothetical protein